MRPVAFASFAVAVAAVAAFALAFPSAPGGGAAPSAVALSPEAVQVVDDAGRTVSLARSPARIVSFAPHATELLFAAGLGERIVAVDPNSDEPAAARALPRLSSYPMPDIEGLLAFAPDLVVVWAPGVSRAQLDRLESLGIAVFVSDPHRLDDVGDTLRRFARLAPDASVGEAAGAAFDERLSAIRARHAGKKPVRVFVQIWSAPLITVSDRDVIGDALRSCGGVNVFGHLAVPAPQLDPEAVLAARPDLVVATDPSPSARRWAAYGLLAPNGPARFVAFDASTFERPGPRALVALERLCDEIDSIRTATRVSPR